MDDFVAALLCLPFVILPAIVLVAIIASKIKASGMARAIWVAIQRTSAEVGEIIPHAEATDLTPGRFANEPRMMSVKAYISETMQILKTQPTPAEIIVERVKPLRFAEATGTFDKALQMLSQMRLSSETTAKS